LRCDANISLRPVGEMKFGTRTEIKNLNSFKYVESALEFEIARQLSILKKGEKVIQETLGYDSATNVTKSMRSKEESADYRYFPDPDLPPIVVEDSWIADIRSRMPKLPEQAFKEMVSVYGLSEYDASVLTAEPAYIKYYEEVFNVCSNAKLACNWVTSELFGALKKAGVDIAKSPVSSKYLGQLLKLIDNETISGKMAKTVFEEMFKTGTSPDQIVKAQGLKQITSEDEILKVLLEVMAKNANQTTEFVGGDSRLHGYFVGLVMKATSGNANPKKVNEVISAELARRRGGK
jgi:aspartyl-tRNA(Asn)/glutamyl-tRNA(Gln) amidotransferase subunit B